MKIFHQVVLLVFILGIQVEAQDFKYEIIRMAEKDRFKLPSFLCTPSWRENCAAMGGTNTTNSCTCECTNGTNNVFGYFDNSWKCKRNSEVHSTNPECLVLAKFSRDESGFLPNKVAVPTNSNEDMGILDDYCKLGPRISYLDCHGKWEPFNQNSSVGFELKREARLLDYSPSALEYQFYTTTSNLGNNQ
ncbi:hypothetical protein AC249_AIPGENE28348 [Exaiptasia diaphana]|nr:hypothetical protein AC249_AIPGENE28348 [Exaiptasia diaphana]